MKRLFAVLFLMMAAFSAFSGCAAQQTYSESTFYAMNTFITVRLSSVSADGRRISEERLAEIHDECERIVWEIEKEVSVTIESSDISRFNDSYDGIADGGVHFSELFTRSLAIAEATDGAFTPTLRPLSDLWDFGGAGYVPTEAEIAALLPHTDLSAVYEDGTAAVKTDPQLRLDFGAVAKGYAAHLLVAYLDTTECRGGLVSLGGNVGLFGEKEYGAFYSVGITDPRASNAVLGYLALTDEFVSVSGDYERYFESDGVRYHHILDPETGAPAQNGLISTAVIAEDGALADALSTALFVMGAEEALALYERGTFAFEAVLVTDDDQVILTAGIAENFDLAAKKYSVTVSPGEVKND